MNNIEFKELIESFITLDCMSQTLDLDNVTTNLEAASSSSIVFYNIRNNKKSEDLFNARIKKSEFGILILNREMRISHIEDKFVVVDHHSFHEVQKILLDKIYNLDMKSLELIGITGTNGKTTIAGISSQISNLIGAKSASIGTLGVYYGEKKIIDGPTTTTPSYVELYKILHYLSKEGFKRIFLEVSSHALDQNRLFDIKLSYALWSNISQDHLDYHLDMTSYFHAKAKIVELLKDKSRLIVPNGETKLIDDLEDIGIIPIIAETCDERDLSLSDPFFSADYNRKNLELAIEVNYRLEGENFEVNYEKLLPPKGRFSTISLPNDRFAIIDYAHTPDAIENVTRSIKNGFKGHKLITLFGCGGDRDKAKRPEMTKAACKFSDKIILTSDNPRTEDPQAIIKDALSGVTSNKKIKKIVDRADAILKGLSELKEKEILLIAGKGHEEYQEINGIKNNFSDFDEVEKYLKGLK